MPSKAAASTAAGNIVRTRFWQVPVYRSRLAAPATVSCASERPRRTWRCLRYTELPARGRPTLREPPDLPNHVADGPELDDFWLTVRLSASLLGCALLLLLRVPILQCLGWWAIRAAAAAATNASTNRASLSARHLRNSGRSIPHSQLAEASTPRGKARRDPRKTITDQAREASVDRFKGVRERLDKMKIQRNMGDVLYVQEVKPPRLPAFDGVLGLHRPRAFQDNFMRSHRDPLLCCACVHRRARRRRPLGGCTLLCTTLVGADAERDGQLAGAALLSTALAPWAWFVSSHADFYADTEHAETIGALQLLIAQARSQVGSLIASPSSRSFCCSVSCRT